MKISREKACQRLHHRVSTPLSVRIEERDYTALDWSLGGFCIQQWDRTHEFIVEQHLQCRFELPFQGFQIAFQIEIEIIRQDDILHFMAAKFVSLDDRQIELMSHFVEQLVRGSMTSIEDTILRIDSPVTPVSTVPDPNPSNELPRSRLPTRLIGMTLLYLALGLLLFSFSITTIYENFLTLKVRTAITSAPVEPIVALMDGKIRQTRSSIEQPFHKGETMLLIESPDLTRKIEQAKIEIERSRLELEAVRKRLNLTINLDGDSNSKQAHLYQIDIDFVQQEISLAMESLVTLYDYKEQLSVLSPSSGRIVDLYRKEGSLVKRGETIGIFERNTAPVIHAFLTEMEAQEVNQNHPAQVRFASIDRSVVGRVIKISPDSGRLLKVGLDYRPADIESRPVLVEIAFDRSAVGQTIYAGLPVEVSFPTTGISQYLNAYLQRRQLEHEFQGSVHPSTVSATGEML